VPSRAYVRFSAIFSRSAEGNPATGCATVSVDGVDLEASAIHNRSEISSQIGGVCQISGELEIPMLTGAAHTIQLRVAKTNSSVAMVVSTTDSWLTADLWPA
jgi:hypothetical protein